MKMVTGKNFFYLKKALQNLRFWFRSRLYKIQNRSLLRVNEDFEFCSNADMGQKIGFAKPSFINVNSDLLTCPVKLAKNGDFA